MDSAQDAIRKALAALTGDGEGRWVPQVTTGQAARQGQLLGALQASNARGNVMAGDWLTVYEADALPPAADPAWTLVTAGSPTVAAASSELSVTGTAGNYAAWYLSDATILGDPGLVLEARVKVTSAAAGADAGATLGINDEYSAYGVFLRPDGLNIAGKSDVPCDLTTFRVVRLEIINYVVRVSVDGDVLTVDPDGYFGFDATPGVWFGSAMLFDGAASEDFPATASAAVWDWVRFRRYQP